ncbi:GGDEF domain-containing protein [Marinospirillum celere]|nr:GGDEF domain-containing protein [Marinospirillum celere]
MDSQAAKAASRQVAQKLRLRRSLMAAGAGFASILVLMVAWYLGYVFWSPIELIAFLLIVSVGHLLFPWIIFSGRNLRYSDPSLTSSQLGWHLAIGTYVMYAAPEIRSLLVINLLLIMLFAVFRFHPRRLPVIALILVVAYGLAVFAQVTFSPIDIHWPHETLTALVFLLAVTGICLLGGEIGGLRMALKNRNAHLALAMQRIEELAVTDELTGLYNRRHLMRILKRQKGLSDRGGYEFSIGFVDLDFFKQVNDRFGHGVGDQVLAKVASEIRHSLRDVDYVARIGGEEFVIVLAQTAELEALRIAERLRADIERLIIEVGEDHPTVKLTTSVGIAQYAPEESLENVMARADQALYAAKECGRNCIIGETDLQASAFPERRPEEDLDEEVMEASVREA